MLKPHDRIFIRLDTIPERDGQTDGNGLAVHCEQCGGAVKTVYVRGQLQYWLAYDF